jgi:Undecaprenyl-phosphate glucose phosphotransferase
MSTATSDTLFANCPDAESAAIDANVLSPRAKNKDAISREVVCSSVRMLDFATCVLAGLVSGFLHFYFTADQANYRVYALPVVLGAVTSSFILSKRGAYSFRNLVNFGFQLREVLISFAATVALLTLIAYATKVAEFYSRSWALIWIAITVGLFVLTRALVYRLLKTWARQGLLTRVVAIVGGGPEGRRLVAKLHKTGTSEVIIAGIFDDRRARLPPEIEGHRILGTTDDLISLARSLLLDDVIIALPLHAEQRIGQLVGKLRSVPVDLRLSLESVESFPIFGLEKLGQALTIAILDRPLKNWARVTKRLEDKILSAVLLAAFLPVMGLIALAIRAESEGPVFFVQRRFGFNNELIPVLKFRTMHQALTDQSGATRTIPNDPRVTRVGRFLRATSLDELPQLINVLRGEMSLVGPRPHVPAMQAGQQLYHEAVRSYFLRHHVRPGITGWAQVHNLRGEIASLAAAQERVAYDLHYIEHWSVWMDLKIIGLTVFTVLSRKNAY